MTGVKYSCKVLYFILSEDEFEIKVENLQS
jgi:hypothetical protein